MGAYWSKDAETTFGTAAEEDFETAAYRLMMEQVIYYTDRGNRSVYHLIEKYERQFSRVLEPFGVSLIVNRINMYAAAIPMHAKQTATSKAETLFALVIRGIYEESLRNSNLYVNDDGEVYCTVHELEEKYRFMVKDELPQGKGTFDNLVRTMNRWGIARYVSDDEFDTDNPEFENAIAIRPAIVDVLGESALAKLACWSTESITSLDIPAAINTEQTEGSNEND
jgi:hypothetical protein